MNGQDTGTATIPAGGSMTAWIDLTNGPLLALIIPAAFIGSSLSFEASNDGITPYEFVIDGNLYAEPASVNQWIIFNQGEFDGVSYLKIRSGSLASPTLQQYDATFQLIGTVQPVFPNARRKLQAEGPGYIGIWPTMLATREGDVITADLTDSIDLDEAISSISFFVLSVVGPDGVTDTALSSRNLGTPSISGAQVSQRFGNWQAIPYILYRVDIQVETSTGNSPEFYGYLPVRQQPN